MNALSSLQTKNNKRKPSRFGGGWVIPLLSARRRGKSEDTLGAATTTKNYGGRHDQQMHTTLFNLANPSQGRRGSGRDKKDDEARAYAGGPATTTMAGSSAVASVAPQPTDNSAESRAVFTARELARDERIYLNQLPEHLEEALRYESRIAVRNAAMLLIKNSDEADVKAYQTYVSRLANAQLTNHIYTLAQQGNAGLIDPKTTTASLESLTKITRKYNVNDPSWEVQMAQMQLNVAGKWTEAHERGRLALVKAEQDIRDKISNMPAVIARGRERWSDELGTAIRLTREAQDIKAYRTILDDRIDYKTSEVTKGVLNFKDNSKFWEAHEQIGSQAKLTPQEERGRLLFLSKGRELDRVTVEQMAKFFQAAPMQTNISAANFRQIMTEDRLKSGFETGTSGTEQGSRQHRGNVETAKMGYSDDSLSIGAARASDATLRPTYGYLGYKNVQDHARQNLAGDYGQITAIFSSAVAPRVTVTQNDSLSGHLTHSRNVMGLNKGLKTAQTIETQSGNPFIPIEKLRGGDASSIRAFISQHRNVEERSIDWVYTLQQARERGTPTKLAFDANYQRYMELQIHSGLVPSRDFAKIIVNDNSTGGRVRSAIATTPSEVVKKLKQFVTKLDEDTYDYSGNYGAVKGLQIALARGIPVTVRHNESGMEVPLIKVGGKRGLFSQSEWQSILQTTSSREKELRAYKTKNNKRKPSRFGGGWIIPLLSAKRRIKSGDALGAATTTKNYGGRHDQQMHTTLFNLANPSQGRRGSGRDKKDEERRAYAGGPAAVASGVAVAGTEAQPSVNVGLLLDRAPLLKQEAFDNYYNGSDGIWSVIPLTMGNTTELSQAVAVDEIRNRALGSTYNVDFKYGDPSPAGQDYLDTQSWLEYRRVGMFLGERATAQQERGNDILKKEMGRIAGMVKGDVNADSLSRSSQVIFKELVRANKEKADVNAYQEFVWAKTLTVRKLQEEKDYLDGVISKIERGISVPQTYLTKFGRREETFPPVAAENPRNTPEYRQLITDLAAAKATQFPAMVSHTSNFWDAQAKAVLDLTPQQQRGREIFEKNGREADTLLRTHLEKLIDAAPLRINMTLENLPKALDSDSYKSAFEVTGTTAAGGRGLQKGSEQGGTTSSGSNRAFRMAAEKKFYGITESSSPTESPIYSYVGLQNVDRQAGKGPRDPYTGERYQGLQNTENISHLYGRVTLNLRPSVRGRATMTPDDSIALLGQSSAAVPLRGSGTGVPPQFLAGGGRTAAGANLVEAAYESAKAGSKKIAVPTQYVETQIFGGVKLSRDVESVSIFVPTFSGDRIRRDLSLGTGNRPRATQSLMDGISRAKSVFNTTAFEKALTSFVSKGVPVEIIASQTGERVLVKSLADIRRALKDIPVEAQGGWNEAFKSLSIYKASNTPSVVCICWSCRPP